LSIVKIRHIKKEIRLLGISFFARNHGIQGVSVVFKGNQTLDGILTSFFQNKDLTIETGKMIIDSKHFNQIRVILFNKKSIPNDFILHPYKLYELTNKPVLCLCKDKEIDDRFMFIWDSWVIFSAGLGKNDAIKVLNASIRKNNYPEVLRIAELVANSLHNI
jgi:endonuclease V-like protein UPF0215 family